MSAPLEELARRAEADEFFLACPLRWFARSESFTDEQMAEYLGCTRETLVKVRLCGAPGAEAPAFGRDIAAVAAEFGVNESALKKAVRRGTVLQRMQSSQDVGLAARDRTPESANEDEP